MSLPRFPEKPQKAAVKVRKKQHPFLLLRFLSATLWSSAGDVPGSSGSAVLAFP